MQFYPVLFLFLFLSLLLFSYYYFYFYFYPVLFLSIFSIFRTTKQLKMMVVQQKSKTGKSYKTGSEIETGADKITAATSLLKFCAHKRTGPLDFFNSSSFE